MRRRHGSIASRIGRAMYAASAAAALVRAKRGRFIRAEDDAYLFASIGLTIQFNTTHQTHAQIVSSRLPSIIGSLGLTSASGLGPRGTATVDTRDQRIVGVVMNHCRGVQEPEKERCNSWKREMGSRLPVAPRQDNDWLQDALLAGS